jgi:LysM repeat protein
MVWFRGDTLTALAKQYNTTVDRIAEDNDVEDIDLLQTGQKLVICTQLTHVAKVCLPFQSIVPRAHAQFRISLPLIV